MKIFAFVDVHAQVRCVKKILRESRGADFLVCAGDLSDFCRGLERMTAMLARSNKKVFMVHGNHEESSDIDKLALKFPFVLNVHRKLYRVGNVAFVGYGGGGFAFEDSGMERFFEKIKSKIRPSDNVVLVTHAPAYGKKVDYVPRVGHRGCISVNRGIKLLKPMYAIVGHLHETAGREDNVGGTLLLNPGCAGRMLEI